jgi:hypothetical protein
MKDFKDKGAVNENSKLLSKISTSKTDFQPEWKIRIQELRLNNGYEADSKVNGIADDLSHNQFIPLPVNTFNKRNFAEEIKEKTPVKINRQIEPRSEQEDLEFEVSELTSNQKIEDSYELNKKRSSKSSRKFKARDVLIIQNENNISINGNKDPENVKLALNFNRLSEKIIDNPIELIFEGNNALKDCKPSINQKIKIENLSELHYEVLCKEISKEEEREISKFADKKEKAEITLEKLSEIGKRETETPDVSSHTLITNDSNKKKVHFSAENRIIDHKEKRHVITYKRPISAG